MSATVRAFRHIVVGAGRAAFLPAGHAGQMKAPNLTVCTAFLLRGYDKNKVFKGYLMGHRQPVDLEFEKNLKKTLAEECPGLSWEVVAVQHANNPTVADPNSSDDFFVSSLDGVAEEVAKECGVSSSDLRSVAERGSVESPGVNQMIVEIDDTGKETVQRRSKGFLECVVM